MELHPDHLLSDKPPKSSISNVPLLVDGLNSTERLEPNMLLFAPRTAPRQITKSTVLIPMVITL